MSKAIVGAVEIAGAVTLGAIAIGTGGLGTAALAAYLNTTQGFSLMVGLAASGVSTEVGAIASSLTGSRSVNITDRRPASNRQIVVGTQMVGGVLVYESVTGHQYNQVIAIASHSIHSILGVYLDGRLIHFKGSGPGWGVRNGVGFGGDADGNEYLGPDGVTKYRFNPGEVYCEARYGDQAFGDYMQSLTAQDPSAWGPKNGDCPSGVGIAYIYLKLTRTSQVPNRPEVRILVNGWDQIYDPRTGTRGFSNNSALVLASLIADTNFGLGDSSINTAQLVAAANLCDEQVAVAAISGSTESRYCTDMTFDTGSSVSDVMETMRANMNARIPYIGGEWWIIPGAYVAPVLSFDQTALTGQVQWNPAKSVRDLPNRVLATHISAEYPYSVFGGYYLNHSGNQNTFDLKFQQSSVPYYAQDVLHGYPSDQWLTEDNGHVRPLSMDFPAALSVTQCQRLMKQALLSARAKQGTGTFEMNLGAYRLQPGDTFQMTFPELGWDNEILEVTSTSLRLERTSNEDEEETLAIRYTVGVKQTDPSVFAWSTIEELDVYASPAAPTQTPWTPNPPTNMELASGAATAIVSQDGIATPVIRVTWDTPLDNAATGIAIQYRETGTSGWYAAPTADISLNVGLISTVVAGKSYDVRIATVRANGALSEWVEQDNFLVPLLAGFQPQGGGWIGKWWRIAQNSTGPANGGELPGATLYETQGGIVNYYLPVTGGVVYQFNRATQVPPPTDGGNLEWIYVRFTCSYVAPATGTYTIGVNSDDGCNVIVNGQTLFAVLGTGQTAAADLTYTQSGTIDLVAGTSYPIVVEYRNGGLSGALQVLCTPPGGSVQLLDLGTTYRDAGSVTYSNGQTAQDLQGSAAAGASESLVPNGNFALGSLTGWSDDSGNVLHGWTLGSDSYGQRVYLASSDSHGRTGLLTPTFSVIPGQKYRLTYRDYTPNAGGGTTYRLFYAPGWAKNICRTTPSFAYVDFLTSWFISATPRSDTFDWTCPDGIHYASIAVYADVGHDLAVQYLSCVPYAGVNQWGADVTGNNTSKDTSFVSGVPSTTIASVVPTGYRLVINNGNKTYSIEAI